MEENKKLKIDIYVPLNVCSCQWEGFMNSVFTELTKYKEFIDFQTKNLKSKKAQEHNLHGNCVVINDEEVIKSPFNLRRKLPKILEKKGLI
ncbi:MAG: hypothetical protein ACOC44_07705 [Promethearchaeia archaeon]